MKSLSKCVLTAVARTAMLACSAVSASTVYACNGNVCWVVKDRHEYPAESKIIIRTETWTPSPPRCRHRVEELVVIARAVRYDKADFAVPAVAIEAHYA